MGIKADTTGRPKHVYGIANKLAGGKEFDEIYDLSAIRVLTDSIKDCYGALGVIHSLWKPIAGRFRDYIAMPKSNGYQSLHTTVVSHSGDPMEIQIRTQEMHRTAEWGVAAHWTYKEGSKDDRKMDQRFAWLRQLMDWQKEVLDAEKFVDAVKIDVFRDEVFVFTPKGDVLALPSGATAVDFAYRIHTEVGHRCIGAKSQQPNGAPGLPAGKRRHRGGADIQRPARTESRLARLRQNGGCLAEDSGMVQKGTAGRERQ